MSRLSDAQLDEYRDWLTKTLAEKEMPTLPDHRANDLIQMIADLRDARIAARQAISEIYGHLCVNEFCEGNCPACIEHEKLIRKLQDVIGPVA